MALVVGGGMRRAGIWLGLGLGLAVAPPAWAESQVVRLDIPAQTLDAALQELAAQSHAQIIYDAALVQGRTSPGVRGELSSAQGLARLLRGSGLKAVPNGDNGFALVVAGGGENTVMEPVVVTATKTPVAVGDLPVSVTVVDKDEIAGMPAHDLSDVLRRVPGVDINRTNPNGAATVSMRGMGFQRSAVLVDGQPTEFLTTGVGVRTAIQSIDPENVERIEVVRGAGSALYGSNAMGGVINVITKQGEAGKPESEVHTGWTSKNARSAGASTRGGVDKVTYSMTANVEDAAGYRPLRETTPDGDYNLNDVTWRTRRLGGTVGAEIADGQKIIVGLNDLYDKSNGWGRPFTESEAHETVISVGSSHEVTRRLLVSTALSARVHSATTDFDWYRYNGTTDWLETLDEQARKYSGEIKAQWDANAINRLLFGAQYVFDSARMTYHGSDNSYRDTQAGNLGFYVQDEIAVTDRLGLTVGARYDSFDYNLHYSGYDTAPVTERSVERTWQTVNPRAALRYEIMPELALRGSVGSAFRAPDTFGLVGWNNFGGSDYRPNPDLKAERSINYDVGTDITPLPGTTLGITGFYSNIRDAIVTQRVGAAPMVIQQVNVGRVVSQGVELEGRQRIGQFWGVHLGYTYTDARVVSQDDDSVMTLPLEGRHLNVSPIHKVMASVAYDEPDFLAARLDGRYVSEQYATSDVTNGANNRVAPYFTADASATYTLPVNATRLLLTAAVTNIADRQYALSAPLYMDEPRTYRLRLGWKF